MIDSKIHDLNTHDEHVFNFCIKIIFLHKVKLGSDDFKISSVKGVVHFLKKKWLMIYSSPCHPGCPCLSFFNRKEIKVFDENVPGFSPYNGLH